MPPKAAKGKEAPAERPILGRFSSHLKIGIVGLPNVGKSTLFNTLTKLSIPAENFPFCTIEPNEARVNVPDERFEWLCQLHKPKSEVSAFLEIHDIAGLVRGAHEGQGLGNSFLSHIRAVDGIFHVLRAFEDSDIIHVDDTVDPVRDLEVISQELRLKDIEFMENRIEDLEKSMKRSNDKQLKIEHELCLKVKTSLDEGKDVRLGDWKAADIEILNTFQLLTAKPVVYLVSICVFVQICACFPSHCMHGCTCEWCFSFNQLFRMNKRRKRELNKFIGGKNNNVYLLLNSIS
nr:obg-like ATPase 1 [Ipomoea batatas]GMD07366.1 obg-like ATPase 1 [Ipomoea batatas]